MGLVNVIYIILEGLKRHKANVKQQCSLSMQPKPILQLSAYPYIFISFSEIIFFGFLVSFKHKLMCTYYFSLSSMIHWYSLCNDCELLRNNFLEVGLSYN